MMLHSVMTPLANQDSTFNGLTSNNNDRHIYAVSYEAVWGILHFSLISQGARYE